jgi:hypothetical protein
MFPCEHHIGNFNLTHFHYFKFQEPWLVGGQETVFLLGSSSLANHGG